jgi:uncharacterized protein (TIGR01777 family)
VSLLASQSKIIIAGGSGFLGQLLAKSLIDRGHEVVVLSRNQNSSLICSRSVFWDAKQIDIWVEELNGADVLINLTGKSIDCRHTKKNREEILQSRLLSTQVLREALASVNQPPSLWLNASSMALYGECFGEHSAYDESSPSLSTGFLEDVTYKWEKEFFKFQSKEVRQIALRISFILGSQSGAFPFLRRLTKLGLGGAQGSGNQWLHQDDWISIVHFLINNKHISGPINLSAPKPLTNRDFMKSLRSLEAPLGIGIPAPAIGVKLGCAILGSAPELALQSRKVVSKILPENDYHFKYSCAADALANLCA